MKINIKVFALSYASVDSDSNLCVDTIGVYDSVESAEKALTLHQKSENNKFNNLKV